MKTNLKAIVIMFVITIFLSSCGSIQFVPRATETQVPTQTALPTYTPMPTYTPYPTNTPIPPTVTPRVIIEPTVVSKSNLVDPSLLDLDIVQFDCPDTNFPIGVSSADCYQVSRKALGVVYFNSKGDAIGIGISYNESYDLGYESGQFIGWAAYGYGWNTDDVVGAIQRIKNPDTWYTYGTVEAKIVKSDNIITIIVKLKSSGIGA